MPDVLAIPDCITNALRRLDQERRHVLDSTGPVRTCQRAVADLPGAAHTNVSVYANCGPGAWVDVLVSDAAAIVELRRRLAAAGFHIQREPQEYPNERRQVHCLEREGGEYVAINFQFPAAEGARCRYVEVGRKEVPVLALKCDGG